MVYVMKGMVNSLCVWGMSLSFSLFLSDHTPRPDCDTCSRPTDRVNGCAREKEGSHISSSVNFSDSLSRLVLMKSHLSLAGPDFISLCLIVLTLDMV